MNFGINDILYLSWFISSLICGVYLYLLLVFKKRIKRNNLDIFNSISQRKTKNYIWLSHKGAVSWFRFIWLKEYHIEELDSVTTRYGDILRYTLLIGCTTIFLSIMLIAAGGFILQK